MWLARLHCSVSGRNCSMSSLVDGRGLLRTWATTLTPIHFMQIIHHIFYKSYIWQCLWWRVGEYRLNTRVVREALWSYSYCCHDGRQCWLQAGGMVMTVWTPQLLDPGSGSWRLLPGPPRAGGGGGGGGASGNRVDRWVVIRAVKGTSWNFTVWASM